MGIDWDQHLLAPLHGMFGDPVEYRPVGKPGFTINGIFDRAYTQVAENLDGDAEINTTKPILGVREEEFPQLPQQGDRLYISTVAGKPHEKLYAVSDVQPDSHGGLKLVLQVVKK